VANRVIPFGYRVELGVAVLHSDEASIVIEIYKSYINGNSYKAIAVALTGRAVSFSSGKNEWNKNMVKRILEDQRYLGDNQYPKLLDAELFGKARHILGTKIAKQNVAKKDVLPKIPVKVVCGRCGVEMTRRHDSRRKIPESWRCESSECGMIADIADEEFSAKITAALNHLINHPELVTSPPSEERHPGYRENGDTGSSAASGAKKFDAEIARLLDGREVDRERLKEAIYRYAEEKYRHLDDSRIITEMIKAEFEKSAPFFTLDANLLRRTVAGIVLQESGDMNLMLKNGQIIGKERENARDINADASASENRSAHSA
jgi:predicted RNA-binding Zn-ribbon protein involved in translation (DUF1610 family)